MNQGLIFRCCYFHFDNFGIGGVVMPAMKSDFSDMRIRNRDIFETYFEPLW